MFCVDLDKKALSLLKTFAHLDLKTFDGKDVLLLCPLIANSWQAATEQRTPKHKNYQNNNREVKKISSSQALHQDKDGDWENEMKKTVIK